MNLLSILSKYKAEDLENESKKLEPISGLAPNELWELEKVQDEPRDFFTFHKDLTSMSSQSIDLEKQ